MSHVKTDIGQIASIDTFNLKLAQTEVFSSLTFSRSEADSALFVTASCGYISDRYTVPIAGVCRACGDTGASSALHGRNERTASVKASVKATSDYFRLSHLNTTQVDVLIKD